MTDKKEWVNQVGSRRLQSALDRTPKWADISISLGV